MRKLSIIVTLIAAIAFTTTGFAGSSSATAGPPGIEMHLKDVVKIFQSTTHQLITEKATVQPTSKVVNVQYDKYFSIGYFDFKFQPVTVEVELNGIYKRSASKVFYNILHPPLSS